MVPHALFLPWLCMWAQALGYPGLHNVFALLIYPGLGLTTENLYKKKKVQK